jgi:hypothetical protein
VLNLNLLFDEHKVLHFLCNSTRVERRDSLHLTLLNLDCSTWQWILASLYEKIQSDSFSYFQSTQYHASGIEGHERMTVPVPL